MPPVDFQMVENFSKVTQFILGFYGSSISQKVSRPWEVLCSIFRLQKLCFKQECLGVIRKLNLKKVNQKISKISAVDSTTCMSPFRASSQIFSLHGSYCSYSLGLSSILLNLFFFQSSPYVYPLDLMKNLINSVYTLGFLQLQVTECPTQTCKPKTEYIGLCNCKVQKFKSIIVLQLK